MKMPHRRLRDLALTALLVVGCALGPQGPTPNGTSLGDQSATVPLDGRVEMAALTHNASLAQDVAPGATVSLIDPATGFTVAGTVTDGTGRFQLTFSNSFLPNAQVYILEAVKGLKDGTGFNAPGSAVARVRTLVRYVGVAWKGLTNQDLVLSTATTALSALANMKGLKDSDASKPLSALFETLDFNTPDGDVVVDGKTVAINARYTPTPDIAQDEYRRVYGLVSVSLADDADPVAAIFRDPGGATTDTRYQRSPAPTAVLGFAEPKATRGQTINLVGRNLSATDAEVWFSTYTGSVDSDLSRNPVKATLGSLSADRRSLQVTVPASAASGQVVYRRGLETYTASHLYGIVGTVVTVVGNGRTTFGPDGLPGDQTPLSNPYFLTMDAADNVLWSDLGHNVIRRWERFTGVVRTVAGDGSGGHTGDGGPARAARISGPVGLSYDASGNLWIAEYSSNYIRKVDPAGIISTVAGNGTSGGTGDNGPASAALVGGPHGLAAHPVTGKIYFCDYRNSNIRMIDPATGIISLVAGGGCVGLQIGPDGMIYIAAGGSVARIDPVTKVRTTWASGVSAGQDIWVDKNGNVYTATWGPGSNQIQRIDAVTKAVTVVAGNGTDGFSGDGGDPKQAAFYRTSGVAIDRAGNAFVADYSNARIRYVGLP
jgi:sugar lactone lactonase YvrE